MKHFSKILLISLALVLVLAPVVLAAVATPPGAVTPPTIGNTSSVGGLKGFACGIAGWVFTVAIILSIIIAIMTGIQYMTAGGDPEKLKSAHRKLLFVVVGIAVALIARVLPIMINGVLGGTGGGNLDVCSGQYTGGGGSNPSPNPARPPGPPSGPALPPPRLNTCATTYAGSCVISCPAGQELPGACSTQGTVCCQL